MKASFPMQTAGSPASSQQVLRQKHVSGWKKTAGALIMTSSTVFTMVACAQENQVTNVGYEAVVTGKNSVLPSNTAPVNPGEPGQPGQEEGTDAEDTKQADIATDAPVPDINTLSNDKQSQDPSKDSMAEPVAVRVGEHTGYDRVVLEFTGPGTPGYRTQYLDKPTRQVSGNPVDIEGETALNVDVTGTTMPVNVATAPVDPIPGKGNIVQVIPAGTFEDNSQFIVDMKTARPYTVTLLENPTRVVIDFQK